LKKFGDSLLSRSSKVSDLITKLETELAAKELDEKSSEYKRCEKPGSQFQHFMHRTFQLFPLTLLPQARKQTQGHLQLGESGGNPGDAV